MDNMEEWTLVNIEEIVYDFEDFKKEFGTYTKIAPTLVDTKPPSKADYIPDLSGRVTKIIPEIAIPGSYSTVFKGECGGKYVAIKAIRFQSNLKAATNMRKFLREAWAWWCLDHENILRLYGVVRPGEFDTVGAMISPWCENGHVGEYLLKCSNIGERLRIFLGVAKGLEHLHFHNIVHGDLKPKNIVIDEKGVPKICDFGLLRLVRSHKTGVTTTTAYTGTIRYLAFELVKCDDLEEAIPHTEDNKLLPTTASDVYALGCLGMEFIYSWPPYNRISSGQPRAQYRIEAAINSGEPPAIRPNGISGKSSELWDVIEACWSHDPDTRPNTCTIVQFLTLDYQRIARSLGISPISPSSQPLPHEGPKVGNPSQGMQPIRGASSLPRNTM